MHVAVIAAVHLEPVPGEVLDIGAGVGEVAAAVLDALDGAGEGVQQAADQSHGERHRGLRGEVIQEHPRAAADPLDNLAEPGEQAVLARVLVEERRQHEDAGAAEVGGVPRQQHRIGQGRRGDAGQEAGGRDAALDQAFQHRDALRHAERVGLARRAQDA